MPAEQTKIKRGLYNGLSAATGVLANMVLGLVIPRLVLLNYGSETNGLINSVNQFVVYLSLFEAGIGTTAMQALYKPVAESDHNKVNAVMASLHIHYKRVGWLYLVFLMLLSVVYPLLVLDGDSTLGYFEVLLIVLFSGLGNVVLFFVQGKYRILLQVEGKNYILSNLQTIISILISVTKIALLLMGFHIVAVIISTFFLNLIQVIYIMWMINTKYKWLDLRTPPSTVALSKKKYVFVHQIAWMIFQNTDVLILTLLCDLKVVSVYSMYKLIVTYLQNILNIPFDSLSFALGQTYSTDIEEYKKRIDSIEVFHSAMCFAVFSVTICLYTPFISLYTQGVRDILYTDKWLPILFVTIELLTFARKPMLNTINYAGHFKETLLPTIIEAAVNLTVSVVGVIQFGIYGALLGTIAALLYRTTDIIVYANVKILSRPFWKTLSIYVLDFLIFGALYVAFTSLRIDITTFTGFILWGCILSVACGFVFIAVHSIVYTQELINMVTYIQNRVRLKISK